MYDRREAMKQAIAEAEEFCSSYYTAPYGNSFNEFRTITIQKFFDSIYQNALQNRIKELEEQYETLHAHYVEATKPFGSSVPIWNETTAYRGGERVMFNGVECVVGAGVCTVPKPIEVQP